MAAIGLLVNFWYGPDLRKSLWWHGKKIQLHETKMCIVTDQFIH
jgi:hypothetical protein